MALQDIWLTGATATIGAQAERGGTRTYQAIFGPSDDENFVANNCGFPIFARHPTDFGKMIVGIEVKLVERGTPDPTGADASLWDVSITYGPINPAQVASPLDMTPVVRVAGTRIRKLAINDKDGDPILNTVGDPYDPPVEKDATSLTIYVRRNEEVGNITTAILNVLGRSDKVNENDWLTFPARSLKLAPLTIPERQYDAIKRKYYYPMEYQFEYKEELWDEQLLNAGFRFLDTSVDPPKLRQVMVDSAPATVPVLLTKGGGKLDPPVDKDNIVINTHKIYEELDYSTLGLDDVFNQQLEPIPPPQDGAGGFD